MNDIVKIEFLDANLMQRSMTVGDLVENPMGSGDDVKVENIIVNDREDAAVQFSNGFVVSFINTPMRLVFAPHPTETKKPPAARTEHKGGKDKTAGGKSGPGGQAPAGSAKDGQ